MALTDCRIWEFNDIDKNKLETIYCSDKTIWDRMIEEVADYDEMISLKSDELRYRGGWLLTDDFMQMVHEILIIVEKYYLLVA